MSTTEEESESTRDAINKIEDVLIKVIRVLANLSISEDAVSYTHLTLPTTAEV